MDDKIIRPGENMEAYVLRRITGIFNDLAEQIGKLDIDEEQATALPMQLFTAQTAMRNAWTRFVRSQQVTVPED
jgi:hypothetical protein